MDITLLPILVTLVIATDGNRQFYWKPGYSKDLNNL